MDHDRLFKELLRAFFPEFLELFFPELAASLDRANISFLDKEIFPDLMAGERREVDLIVQARLRTAESFFLIHLEHQAEAEPSFARRMFAYFARLHEKYNFPVYPIVLCSYDKPRRPEPDEYRLAFPDLEVLTFRFRVVQLNRLEWRDYAQRSNPVAAALMARMHRTATEKPTVLRHALELLASLQVSPAHEYILGQFLEAYLPLTPPEKATVQAEINLLPPEKKEKTMAKAMGFFGEGQLLHAQELVCRQLRMRLGGLDATTEARVTALNLRRLDQLGEALLDFTGPADLEAWLKKHTRK